METKRGKIMYCAFPTRLRELRKQVKERAKSWGYAPVIPFDCGDYEDFEGNPEVGREQTLEFMLGVMRACHVVGIFGISRGVMGELKNALDLGMEVHVFHGLDPEWEKYYEELRLEYGDLLKRLRGNNHLIALVGARAVGKTFWSNRLLERFGDRLQRVKNTTTRPVRDASDHESYNFTDVATFKSNIEKCRFLEWTSYQGNYYGSSLTDIRGVVDHRSGIFAITPSGATALHAHRFEMNLKFIVLRPANRNVLAKNFDRRGIADAKEREKLFGEVDDFGLPPEVDHKVIEITGDTERDEQKIIEVVEPLIQ